MKTIHGVDLKLRIDEAAFVVLDVETTGLHPSQGHRVIDISMIKWQGGKIVNTFGTLINPGRPISAGATAVHGITAAQLVGAPIFVDIADQVWQFLEGAVVVAHNAEFDVRFVNWELARAGYEQWRGVIICTLAMARHLQREKHNKLSDVAFRMGIEPERQHSAVGDAMTTLRIFEAFLQQLIALNAETIGNILRAQGGWQDVPKAPTGRALEAQKGRAL